MSIHKTDRGYWKVRWKEKVNGKIKQYSKNFETRYLAKEFEQSLGSNHKPQKNCLETFREFSDRFMRDYFYLKNAKSTWRHAETRIKKYMVPAFGHKPLANLNGSDWLLVERHLKALGRSDKTINNVLQLAKRILNVAIEWDVITENPFRKAKYLPIDEQATDYWSEAELQRFFSHVRVYDPVMWEITTIAAFTGMRKGEILGLCRDMIDLEHKRITVKRKWDERAQELHETTKTKNQRTVPMHDEVYAILKDKRLLAPSQRLYPMTTISFTRSFQRTAKRIGLRPIRFHDLRHTFASHLVLKGVPLYHVMKLLGHKTIDMTQRYSHLRDDDLRQAIESLVPSRFPLTTSDAVIPLNR